MNLKEIELKRKLELAKLDISPREFKRRTMISAVMSSLALTLFFAFVTRFGLLWVYPLILLASFVGMVSFYNRTLDLKIYHLQRELDKEVLFAGRYLLLKINSGIPILQALTDAASDNTVAGDFFKGIVTAINTGTPIEEALEQAREKTPSSKFKKVLYPLIVSLKTGADVTYTLEETLASIRNELALEIKEYGKKLNTIVLLYLVLAIVLPSLGFAISLVFLTFVGIILPTVFIWVVVLLLAVVQYFFISIIKSVRPVINL
ncbi:MAG TPA: hypothetical protein ENN46_02150 [Candidatus Woesearchaeota archaeon]|nr:hypothetical protein [Candidatus Woesearchaeota archaeon]